MTINLDGQVTVITGGSRGIGRATVKAFAEAGAKVVFSYRKAAGAAREVVRSADPTGEHVAAERADVSKNAVAKRLIDSALRRFGRLDILVANAGIWNARPAPIQKMSEREWDEMLEINLKGVYSVIRFAVPSMI